MEALAGVNARRAVHNQFVATYHKAVAQILEQLDNMEEETRNEHLGWEEKAELTSRQDKVSEKLEALHNQWESRDKIHSTLTMETEAIEAELKQLVSEAFI